MQKPSLLAFMPDIQIRINVDSRTGQTVIETDNAIPLNPLNLASICLSVALSQVQTIIKQTSMIIDKSKIVSTEPAAEPAPSNGSAE